MVAQQHEEIAIERGGAAMSPESLERGVLGAEMPGPDDAALQVERDNLAVAEPRVNAFAVGDRRRRGEVVLLVDLGQRPRRLHAVLPQPLAVGAVNASTTSQTRCSRIRPRSGAGRR